MILLPFQIKFPPAVKCRPDCSTWTLGDDEDRGTQVRVEMAKGQPGVAWPVLAAGGALYEADSVCDIDVD